MVLGVGLSMLHSLCVLAFVLADDGDGMNPNCMQQLCMSLGFSAKSKSTNTIGECECFSQGFNIVQH